jgi:hypothetical protein
MAEHDKDDLRPSERLAQFGSLVHA